MALDRRQLVSEVAGPGLGSSGLCPDAVPGGPGGATTGELSIVLPFYGIAGVGTYEGGILAGLVPLGIELETALKGAVNLHLFVLGIAILAGVLAALFPARKENPDEAPEGSTG